MSIHISRLIIGNIASIGGYLTAFTANNSDTLCQTHQTRSRVLKVRKGLIVVLTGNGKGKTTSALGMALRAYGHGMKVCIIQFMKGDLFTGEWDAIKSMGDNIEIISTGKGFCGIQGNPYPWNEHRDNAFDAILFSIGTFVFHCRFVNSCFCDILYC